MGKTQRHLLEESDALTYNPWRGKLSPNHMVNMPQEAGGPGLYAFEEKRGKRLGGKGRRHITTTGNKDAEQEENRIMGQRAQKNLLTEGKENPRCRAAPEAF